MIKKETILSNYDKKLTLLQWLKQVQGQLKDLKEKGVKAVVEKFDTPEAFYNAYATKEAGTPVFAIVGSDTAIYGTLGEFTDKVNVKGIICQGDNVYTSAEADALSIVGTGELASLTGVNDAISAIPYSYFEFETEEAFAKAITASSFVSYKDHFVTIKWKYNDQGSHYAYAYGYLNYVTMYGLSFHGFFTKYVPRITPKEIIILNPILNVQLDKYINVSGQWAVTGQTQQGNGIFSPTEIESQWTTSTSLYGPKRLHRTPDMTLLGGFIGSTNSKNQGIIIDETNKEIYYGLNGYMAISSAGEVENAISGTQLKEAVRLATQKTYWHTINLHNSGTLSDVHITIVIPSHSSNPVANDQDLLAIGAGDTWGCSGTIATTESSLPIVTFDGVKFGATADATIFSGTLGRTYTLTQLIAKSLEYSDNVKEVK